MITVKPNITQKLEVDIVTDDGKDINDILKDYKGKTIGIVAHRAPQLAFEVITKKISWEEANKNDLNNYQNSFAYTYSQFHLCKILIQKLIRFLVLHI